MLAVCVILVVVSVSPLPPKRSESSHRTDVVGGGCVATPELNERHVPHCWHAVKAVILRYAVTKKAKSRVERPTLSLLQTYVPARDGVAYPITLTSSWKHRRVNRRQTRLKPLHWLLLSWPL